MRYRLLATFFLISFIAGLVGAQSLSELAKKEKERRKKNKEKGQETLVITEAELTPGKSGSSSDSSTQTTRTPSSSRSTASRRGHERTDHRREIARQGGRSDRLA